MDGAALCWGERRATPPGDSLDVSSSTLTYLDIDSLLASSCGMPSGSHSFLLPDELPSPLDARAGGSADAAALLPTPTLLPLHLDAVATAQHAPGAGPSGGGAADAAAALPRALSFTGGSGGLHHLGDQAGGAAKRLRTDAGAPAAGGGLAPGPVVPPAAKLAAVRRAAPQRPAAEKRKGPCQHCGTVESPLWRKGPPGKPILCNRCGTKHSRGHSLGPGMLRAPQQRRG